jgi:single-strand DNA-binding protein
LNNVNLIGRITKDLVLNNAGDTHVANFTLAVDKPIKKEEGKETTDFILCQAWGKRAEMLVQYCGKGSQIAISGRINTRSYDDKDGKKVYVVEVVAESVTFLDRKEKSDDQRPNLDKPKEYGNPKDMDTSSLENDDLPF